MADPAQRSHAVRGYCALCTAHCATIATVENGRVTRLDPDHDHPNGGVICIKGKAAPELVYNQDRLDYPLRRTRPKGAPDPGWQRVSWDEALDDIAQADFGNSRAPRREIHRACQRHQERHICRRCRALARTIALSHRQSELGVDDACLQLAQG